jgi:CTP synthase
LCGALGSSVDDGLREKIALLHVKLRAVVPMVTIPVLYEVPLMLERAKIGDYLLERMDLKARRKPDWKDWERLVANVQRSKPTVRVALVGKYVELHDAYMSVRLLPYRHPLGIEVCKSSGHSAELEKGVVGGTVYRTDHRAGRI